MFESLQDKLAGAFKTLKGKGRITDVNIAATVKEIRRALIDADVNYKVAKDVTDRVKQEALDRKVMVAVEPGQLFTKIVQDELTTLMGGTTKSVNITGSPAVILIAGLQGSGKTTFSGKFANYLKKQGKQVMLVAADVYRPAAITQLQVLGEQIKVDVYAELDNKNAVDIARNALKEAKARGKNIIIIDTAGRLAVDEIMMQEVEDIKKATNPTEILFVVDSMTGQDAVNTAKTF
jgi:signal recognition particle subunit SRP54